MKIDGNSLTIAGVVKVADGERVTLSEGVLERLTESRGRVELCLEKGLPAYGINTGFGALCNVTVRPGALRELQENLVRSHASGAGEPFPVQVVRAAMLLRANSLCRGQSGVRPVVVDTLLALLNEGITPAVHSQGSLGASGDLAPLADLALVLMGEGMVIDGGCLVPSAPVLEKHGIKPIVLEAKEGLALLNGTAFMSAMACLNLHAAGLYLEAQNASAALCIRAFGGHSSAYHPSVLGARPHPGAVDSAGHIRRLLDGAHTSSLYTNGKVQDPYSFRCVPQVHGALHQAIEHARSVMTIEINSTTDNPLVLPEGVISGGNFHGQPIGAAMDYLALAVTPVASMSERRVDQMMHPNQSGLPAFLAVDPGVASGFMIAQYTAASLVNECRVLSTPASVQSIPVSADQEDHISMATYASRKAGELLKNAFLVAAVELLTAAQALDMRGESEHSYLGGGTRATYDFVRRHAPFVQQDVPLAGYMANIAQSLMAGALHTEIEETAGELNYGG